MIVNGNIILCKLLRLLYMAMLLSFKETANYPLPFSINVIPTP